MSPTRQSRSCCRSCAKQPRFSYRQRLGRLPLPDKPGHAGPVPASHWERAARRKRGLRAGVQSRRDAHAACCACRLAGRRRRARIWATAQVWPRRYRWVPASRSGRTAGGTSGRGRRRPGVGFGTRLPPDCRAGVPTCRIAPLPMQESIGPPTRASDRGPLPTAVEAKHRLPYQRSSA